MSTTESSLAQPMQDERIMAALSHLAIVLPFMGVIAPTVIWVTQKDKSRFVAFQALQALVYQLVLIVAGFIVGICAMLSFVATMMITVPFVVFGAAAAGATSVQSGHSRARISATP